MEAADVISLVLTRALCSYCHESVMDSEAAAAGPAQCLLWGRIVVS